MTIINRWKVTDIHEHIFVLFGIRYYDDWKKGIEEFSIVIFNFEFIWRR